MKTVLFVLASLFWCRTMEPYWLYVYAGAVALTALLKYRGIL